MKATDLLQQQHRQVEATFKKIKEGGSGAKALILELANDLAAHMAIEQNLLYPAVRDLDEELIDESFEEHSIAEVGLKRLLHVQPDDGSFEAKLTLLEELVLHHVEEEENELFPQLEQKLGSAKLETLGRELEKAFIAAKKEGFEALVPQGFARTSADEARKALGVGGGAPSRPNGHVRA